MSFEFRPARLEGVGLFIAIAGSSQTGKTYTALRLARGIAGKEGKIAAIDTEGKRMSHYSQDFAFDVFNMRSPFSPFRFSEAAKGAEDNGYSVLVIDSFSLEWSGLGGVLALFEEHHAKTGNNEKMKDICWSRAKAPHKFMINDLIQCTMPIIFCLRANEVPKHLAGGVDGRWKVEQDKRFLYEWTISLTLHPDTPGMPRYDMQDAKGKPLWKVQDQHRHLFPEGKLIGEDVGAALQSWRNSGEARALGSQAIETRKQTIAEWLDDLEESLSHADTVDAVEAIADRDGVKMMLTQGSDVAKQRTNHMINAALQRVDQIPAFAAGAA